MGNPNMAAIAEWFGSIVQPGETLSIQKHKDGRTTVRMTWETVNGEEWSAMDSPSSWSWHDVLITLGDELPEWRRIVGVFHD